MKILILALLYLSLASTFGIAKLVLSYGHPVFIIGIRMVLAGTLLLMLNRARKQTQTLSGAHVGLFIQLSFFHIYCAFITEFWALQYLSGAKACLMYSLSPFVTALLEYYLFAKRITLYQFYGLGVGFLGLLTIIGIQGDWWSGCQMGTILCLPDLALLLSVVSASYGWILLKKLTVEYSYPLLFANGVSMLGAGVAALATTALIPGSFGIHAAQNVQTGFQVLLISALGTQTASIVIFWGAIILLIVIANVIFYNVYGYLLRSYSPTFLSFAGFTAPLCAAGYDWLLFSIVPPTSFFLAVLVIFFGLYLFYQDELTLG